MTMINIKSWAYFKEYCKNYKYIIISGPQRSGTTYVSEELATELNYRHVDEMEHGIFQINKMLSFIGTMPVVIQAPALSHKLHTISNKDTLVVFMMRNDHEITESEDRINWHKKHSQGEFNNYAREFVENKDKINSFKRCAPMKKWIWNNLQKNEMQVSCTELQYDLIKQSKGYIAKEDRTNFKKKQTK